MVQFHRNGLLLSFDISFSKYTASCTILTPQIIRNYIHATYVPLLKHILGHVHSLPDRFLLNSVPFRKSLCVQCEKELMFSCGTEIVSWPSPRECT